MYLQDLALDILSTNPSKEELKDFLEQYKNLNLDESDIKSIISYKRYLNKRDGTSGPPKEKQCTLGRKWHTSYSILNREEAKKYLKPEYGTFNLQEIHKDYAELTFRQIQTIILIMTMFEEVDFFSSDVRNKIFEADSHRCRICKRGTNDIRRPLHTHHIMPGGGDHFENGVTVCYMCHWHRIHKKNRLPPEGTFFSRKTWDECVEASGIVYVPKKTPNYRRTWDSTLRSHV